MSFGCCLVSSQSRQTFFAPRFCSGRDPPHRELLGKRQIEDWNMAGNPVPGPIIIFSQHCHDDLARLCFKPSVGDAVS